MHERAAIRQAVVSILKGTAPDYATDAGDRVSTSRLAPQRGKLLPAIAVYILDEVVDDVVGTALRRTATLAIDVWAATRLPDELEDQLDTMALQVEDAIEADPFLGLGLIVFRGARIESTEIGVKLETDQPVGCAHLEFSVVYETQPRVLAPADDFLRVKADHEFAADQFNVR
jgi:hypothetical protein